MNKKSTLILLSILHICIMGICVLAIYSNKTTGITVAHVSSDAKAIASHVEPEEEATTEWNTEPKSETEIETETITQTASEISTEQETEAAPVYSYHYIGKTTNLNIRDNPSMKGAIIGKIPVGGYGDVLTLTNDDWALIDYQGTTGYCSRKWIELEEMD